MNMDSYMRRLSDLLSTLYDKNKALSKLFDNTKNYTIDLARPDRPRETIEQLCENLLTSQGEVSGITLAYKILERYNECDEEGKKSFFEYLNNQLDLDLGAAQQTLDAYIQQPSKATYRAFMSSAEPKRQELARRLNQVPGSTGMLVELRKDLLRFLKEDQSLGKVDLDFRHLFASWFNRGFLVLQPISWNTPANILEKIIEYEAVHAIDSWDDLRRRLKPEDRRCFAFFHPSMAEEPLIFVEVALTKGIPSSIQDVLAEGREPLNANEADTAVFYSISNCQEGLAGISFGNSLIKQVVSDLVSELSNIKTFVTLSPIPGLSKWVEQSGNLDNIDDEENLKSLASSYLLHAKHRTGLPLDPVARFHLNNGAMVHKVHTKADLSANGIRQSYGTMVNYLYDLNLISQNHENLATNKEVVASKEVQTLADKALEKAAKKAKELSTCQAETKEQEREEVMSNPLFDALFGRHAGQETPFLQLLDGSIITHNDFLKLTAKFANTMTTEGLNAGDRIAVQIEKSPEALAVYAAAVQAGIIFLPLNTAYTAQEVSYFLENSGAKMLLCDNKNQQALTDITEKCGAKLHTLDANGQGSFKQLSEQQPETFITVARTIDDLAAFLYTSGTTGRSKGAMLSQNNLLSNAEALVEYWQFTEKDVLLHALPIFHTHGLFVACNVTLLAGGSMIFMPKLDLDAFVENMPKATSMMGVPTFYTRLLSDERFNKELTSHMRLFISGSAPLLAETHIEFEQRTGHRILERYGMTETNMSTSNPYESERKAGTVGHPLPGVEIRITDKETGEEVSAGETGVLEVRGPNVFKGYWQMPEKTAEEFRDDGYFISGDLAKIDEDGYIIIVGRDKDLIISGGYNIYPKEIELILDDQPGVLESAVIGVPHPDFGETVVGILVKNNKDEINLETIEDALGNNLARFKQPRKLIVVDELPRNTMGKVQKNILRTEYENSFQ